MTNGLVQFIGIDESTKHIWVKVDKILKKKVNRKVQEEPQADVAVNPRHQEEEKKVTQINVCIANKQMHDKHKDQLPLPQAR